MPRSFGFANAPQAPAKGMHGGCGKPLLEHSFLGQLATIQSWRTLHITIVSNGINNVDHAISNLSRLEEHHLIDCQVSNVPSGLLQLHQLRALQICSSFFDDHPVLPKPSLLPELRNLAAHCKIEELLEVLLNFAQLISFSCQGRQGAFDLPSWRIPQEFERDWYRKRPCNQAR